MPSLSIYNNLQSKLEKFKSTLLVIWVSLGLVAFLMLYATPTGKVLSKDLYKVKVFASCMFLSIVFCWLHRISMFQKESLLTKLPIVGPMFARLKNKSASSEVLQLNFHLLFMILACFVSSKFVL